MMVNLKAENHKLRGRALEIVQRISGVSGEAAAGALSEAKGNVKIAILRCAGAGSVKEAKSLLAHASDNLRAALLRLKTEI
jgi:N-acetylmuramic acid 6-phosphate etherase